MTEGTRPRLRTWDLCWCSSSSSSSSPHPSPLHCTPLRSAPRHSTLVSFCHLNLWLQDLLPVPNMGTARLHASLMQQTYLHPQTAGYRKRSMLWLVLAAVASRQLWICTEFYYAMQVLPCPPTLSCTALCVSGQQSCSGGTGAVSFPNLPPWGPWHCCGKRYMGHVASRPNSRPLRGGGRAMLAPQ